ncbi:hypothetical protein AB4454_18385, partial [Vibrio artabrorum]|uniref:hypothetical protein n=1 Tax=Vibrio artabrorum TaxID=446374 RepID=UPI00354BD6B4
PALPEPITETRVFIISSLLIFVFLVESLRKKAYSSPMTKLETSMQKRNDERLVLSQGIDFISIN